MHSVVVDYPRFTVETVTNQWNNTYKAAYDSYKKQDNYSAKQCWQIVIKLKQLLGYQLVPNYTGIFTRQVIYGTFHICIFIFHIAIEKSKICSDTHLIKNNRRNKLSYRIDNFIILVLSSFGSIVVIRLSLLFSSWYLLHIKRKLVWAP